jgi:hypothetical protein
MITAKADTIDGNLEDLLEIANALAKQGSDLDIEIHRIWVDLSEGIADLRQNSGCHCDEPSACMCDQCECDNDDDYTAENGTCEECFRDCLPTEGGE